MARVARIARVANLGAPMNQSGPIVPLVLLYLTRSTRYYCLTGNASGVDDFNSPPPYGRNVVKI